VDVGGRTIDVALIEINDNKPELMQYDTWFSGMLSLQSSVIASVNSCFSLSLNIRHAEKILRQGLVIDGELQDISFLQGILQNHFDELFTMLKLRYPVTTTPIYLCGGGATFMYRAFQKRFPNVYVMENSQFANAIGFYRMGLRKFGAERRVTAV
jgi:plasmid segregation protein ParM